MQYDLDVRSDHKTLFLLIRRILIEDFKLLETRKQRITSYSTPNGGVCHMRTTKSGVDIGFLKGIHMIDTYNKLTGTGKVMRVLSIKDAELKIIIHYLSQAIKISTTTR
ncbi:hypothetical protein A1QK_01340 [Vibrio genomosp. F10 str. 9ZD137]|uniref:YdhG-like domain-containing protein n=2 Tax=Vibrio genomosp. F10 TaxID=723171 RepID=A0A1E5BJ27_9VIBR|nr:hypothetical protein A1QO_17290 [Vibrio genomosp. F10 str. ZF-129]OEF03719.1 hypothetical protein A1QK_01340 [Vibrio genomosp. F10 str. 9ZD137]